MKKFILKLNIVLMPCFKVWPLIVNLSHWVSALSLWWPFFSSRGSDYFAWWTWVAIRTLGHHNNKWLCWRHWLKLDDDVDVDVGIDVAVAVDVYSWRWRWRWRWRLAQAFLIMWTLTLTLTLKLTLTLTLTLTCQPWASKFEDMSLQYVSMCNTGRNKMRPLAPYDACNEHHPGPDHKRHGQLSQHQIRLDDVVGHWLHGCVWQDDRFGNTVFVWQKHCRLNDWVRQ